MYKGKSEQLEKQLLASKLQVANLVNELYSIEQESLVKNDY
jgi:hypothetical protein